MSELAHDRRSSFVDRATVAVFVLALGAPSIAALTQRATADDGSAAPAPELAFDLDSVLTFPDRFNAYFEGRIARIGHAHAGERVAAQLPRPESSPAASIDWTSDTIERLGLVGLALLPCGSTASLAARELESSALASGR